MKANQIRIQSDGTARGTSFTTAVGEELKSQVMGFVMHADRSGLQVDLRLVGSELDVIAACTNIEDLAKELHEAGRAAVEQGATVAAGSFGEKARKFLEWDDITEEARDGRRMQATYLLQKYYIREKV